MANMVRLRSTPNPQKKRKEETYIEKLFSKVCFKVFVAQL